MTDTTTPAVKPATPAPAAQPMAKPAVAPQATRSVGPQATGGGAQHKPSAQASIAAFQFMPVTSEKRSKYLNILLYGIQGGGKTTLAGSACNIDEASDVLLVTAEGGDIVFADNDRIERPDRIDMMKVDRIEQLQKTYEWIKFHCRFRDQNNEAELRKLQNMAFLGRAEVPEDEIPEEFKRLRRYKTVIIDSLTDVEALNMNHIMGVSDKGFDVGDDLNPAGYTEFRKNNNTIQQLVRAFRNLPVHLILICGQKWQKDEMQRFHYGPWMTGQLATQVQSFVDIVGYMVNSFDQAKGEIRKLYVQPVAQVKFDAKCRIASFKGTNFEDPTFADILRACKYIE